MTHWGWHWKVKLKHTPKDLVSNYVTINSFQLCKKNIKSFSYAPHHINAKHLENCFEVNFYNDPTKGSFYKIPIEKQPCHFGGFRYFFHCPNCNRRMQILYSYKGFFLCRKCLNLSYKSQQLPESMRLSEGSQKIDQLLKKKGGSLSKKPKWMRWKTFKRLSEKHWNYEERSDIAFGMELLANYGHLLFKE